MNTYTYKTAADEISKRKQNRDFKPVPDMIYLDMSASSGRLDND